MQADYVITRKSNYVLIANIFHSCSDFNRFKCIHDTQKYSSNKIVKDNHSALYYRNILLAVNVIISCVCIEIYRGPLSWPPCQARLVQVISKCLIYTATHFFFHIRDNKVSCPCVIYYLYSLQKIQICASTTILCIVALIYCFLFTQRNIVIMILYLLASFSNTCIFKTLNILSIF